jgi:hypothetical protein
MKTFGKKSISSILRIAIDLMLITEVIALLYRLIPIISKFNTICGNSPVHSEDPGIKYLLFSDISIFIFGLVAFLITLQLRKLLNNFKKEIIFEPKNVKRIKTISAFLLLYVIAAFLIELLKDNLAVHLGDFPDQIGKMPLNDIYNFKVIVSAMNFKLLFVSIVIYILASVFQIGSELKEETTLTI